MMIEICLERHSDSQVLRSAEGERQGNAVTITVSQIIVSALECFSPSTLQMSFLDWIKKAAHSASKKPRSMQCTHEAKGGFPNKGTVNVCVGACKQMPWLVPTVR